MMKLLVVDDSALMRRHMRDIFEAENDFDVRVARNGADALAQLGEFAADVVTLDVNMPEMDGITCLERIMKESPRPVVMVSSLTTEGADVTLQALALGAVDFIPKPGGTVSLNLTRVRAELVAKVRAAVGARIRRARGLSARLQAQRTPMAGNAIGATRPPRRPMVSDGVAPGVVLVGVSTGGPRVLEDILPELPADFPLPIVIAQHMPSNFTGFFARRLDAHCAVEVVEVDRPLKLDPGRVYIARGDADAVLSRRGGTLNVLSVPSDPKHLWHPSVTRLVESALQTVPAETLIGVQLTGMGDDGAEMMAQLRKRGGRTIAESEETAVVFGMPKELIRHGGASEVLRADAIARRLCVLANDVNRRVGAVA